MFKISAIDEFFNKRKAFGVFSKKSISTLVKFSKLKNSECLNFISLDQATIFSKLQAQIIVEELEVLKLNGNIDKNLINSIEKGVNFLQEHVYIYLQFIPKSTEIIMKNKLSIV